MEELIAKKYIKALKSGSDVESMKAVSSVFGALADSFKDDKFVSIVSNPNVAKDDKATLLLEAVKPASSEKLNNFVKLLVEHKRINIIPAMAKELAKDIANETKTYTGTVYSNSDIDAKVMKELSAGLGKRFDSTITLEAVKNDFNGIKVEVEGLGVEINFSQDRINSQIIDHIIQAI